MPGQHLVIEARNNLLQLEDSGIKTHVYWVPGHVNVAGNELADKLAKTGAQGTRIESDVLTSITYLKRNIKEHSLTTWKAKWKQAKKGRSYHGQPALKPSAPLRGNIPRRTASTITQMRTGHGYTKSYLARIPTNNIEDSKCKCGFNNQTPQHLLLECGQEPLPAHRKALKAALKPMPLTWRTAMHTNAGLATTIATFLIPTQIATRNWTLQQPEENRYPHQGLHLYNDEEEENERERENG